MARMASRLFGRLALQTGLVTQEQMEECIDLQAQYEAAGKKVPRMGELMAMKGYLSVDQVRQLLQQQHSAPPAPAPEPELEAYESGEIPQPAIVPAATPPAEAAPADTAASRRKANSVFGKFKILRKLGMDATSYTYKTKHAETGQLVTLHILNKQTMEDDPTFVADFERQIKRAAGLRHPGIQRPILGGRVEGRMYYAAEYVDGRSLRRELDRAPLPVKQVLTVARQTAEALRYGHERGIYHRALSPSMILLGEAGEVKLVGYGAARNVVGNLQILAERFGDTPFYVAPEQALEGGAEIDGRADIFSLGAILYHCVTGTPPFQGDSIEEVLLSITESDTEDLTLSTSDAPKPLQTVIKRMLQPDPEDRYQTVAALADDLQAMGAAPAAPAAAAAAAAASPVMGADESTYVLQDEEDEPEPARRQRPARDAESRGRPRRQPRPKPNQTVELVKVLAMVVGGAALLGILIYLSSGQAKKAATRSQRPVDELTPSTPATPQVPAFARTAPDVEAEENGEDAEPVARNPKKPEKPKKEEEPPPRFGLGFLGGDDETRPKKPPRTTTESTAPETTAPQTTEPVATPDEEGEDADDAKDEDAGGADDDAEDEDEKKPEGSGGAVGPGL